MGFERRPNAIECLGVKSGIANDAALAYAFAAYLELRLNENHKLAGGFEKREKSRKNERDGDKADVADDEMYGLADIGGLQVACVGALVKNDSSIGAEFPIDLSCAGIDAVDTQSAVLEQAIGEASRGGSDVKANFLARRDGEFTERGLEFKAAAAHKAERLVDFDFGIETDGLTRFCSLLPVHRDFAGKNKSLRFFAGSGKSAINQRRIEAEFGGHGWAGSVTRIAHNATSRMCPSTLPAPFPLGLALNDEIGELAQTVGAIVERLQGQMSGEPLLLRHLT